MNLAWTQRLLHGGLAGGSVAGVALSVLTRLSVPIPLVTAMAGGIFTVVGASLCTEAPEPGIFFDGLTEFGIFVTGVAGGGISFLLARYALACEE